MRITFPAARLLLAIALIAHAPAAHSATAPAKKPAKPTRPDSTAGESAPAPFIRPAPPETSAAPEDTALASIRRRAREQYGRGVALERQGAYAAAIVSYTEAARTDPTLRGASYRIGQLFAWKRQFDPAARAFREELHRDPDNKKAATQYALMLCELGDTTRPVRMLEELTRQAPDDPEIWRALGFVYARADRREDAERALRGSIGLNDRYAAAWRDLGVLLADRGDEKGARDAYQRALALDPNELPTMINLANLEGRSGNHEAALATYRAAEKRDSTYADAYAGQIRELVVLGREKDAGAVWKRWLQVLPDDEVREGAARHYLRQGRADVAVEIARNGVRSAPDEGEPRWLLGEMQLAQGDSLAALGGFLDAWARFQKPGERARADSSLAVLRGAASPALRTRIDTERTRYARADSARAARALTPPPFKP